MRLAFTAMRTVAAITVAVALMASLAGCGARGKATTSPLTASVPSTQGGPPPPTRAADPLRSADHRQLTVKLTRTAYGRALTDGRGFALYRFTHDRSAPSTCYAACAAAWPPYLVTKRSFAAGPGGDARLLGAVARADGRLQVTYAGHPLYYYVGDRHPGEVLCQAVTEFGGSWYVVAPDGSAIS